MSINNLSRASNKLAKMLRNKYRIKASPKAILEMLKIIEANEKQIGKFTKNFSPKNQILLEELGAEIISLNSQGHGSLAIFTALKKTHKEVPSKNTIYRFLQEVKNG